MPVTIALAFILAYLLFLWVKRGRVILRTAYFLPYVTNSAAIALVFAWIFDVRIGVMNAALARVGLPTLTWLNDPFPMAKRLIEMVYARILAPSPALPEIRGVITANVVEEVMLQQLSPEDGVKKLKAEADAAIRNATM